MSRFEYFEEIGRVLPTIDEGEPSPEHAEYDEAARLEAALRSGDARVEFGELHDGSVDVVWRD